MALPARMASRLLHLDGKIGYGSGSVPVSQADLADFVAATREGVAKTLAEWRDLGWVALARGKVRHPRAACAGSCGAGRDRLNRGLGTPGFSNLGIQASH